MDHREKIPQPYLVQRLSRCGSPRMQYQSIDRDFELEYMGSSEFEFGQANKQLRALVSCHADLRIEEVKLPASITTNDGVLWYLGRVEQMPEAQAFIEDQLSTSPRLHFQERPELREVLIPGKWVPRATGWWAYTAYSRGMQYPWVLFLKHPDAVLFLDGVQRYAAKEG